ncbi:Bifunctional nuclease 1 [Camellia lanceoleosa]|uniref:Bifunctional nuclease 1 n=1 Tax=Camellia lanceoleosa TaxID=1840588 RepID=A0ACC0H448_9ERIC|nr:Bifunctional nuclease 1 [Camellia lanceoleosa]
MKAKFLISGFWGFSGIMGARINVSHQLHMQQCKKVHCSFSSSSNGNGSMAKNFNENDEDYVNSSVVETHTLIVYESLIVLLSMDDDYDHVVQNSIALSSVLLGCLLLHYLLKFVTCSYMHRTSMMLMSLWFSRVVEVKSGPDGFMIKMRDGRHLRCVHNNPQGGHLPDYAPHPVIVLKMEDGTGLFLPIIVLEMPSVLLMAAIRNARPTMYQVTKEMVDKMGYAVITKRVHEAYFAQLYLTNAYLYYKPLGNETESVSFDLRPSDAINIAIICKLSNTMRCNKVYNEIEKKRTSGKVSHFQSWFSHWGHE